MESIRPVQKAFQETLGERPRLDLIGRPAHQEGRVELVHADVSKSDAGHELPAANDRF